MEIKLGEYDILVEIVRKNNKNIYFRFKDNGILNVTCNYFVSDKQVKKIIIDNEKSLLNMYSKFLKHKEKDNYFYYLGKPYVIVYDSNVSKMIIDDNYIYIKDDKMLDRWYKKECQKIFADRVNTQLVNFKNIPVFSLRIRKMKTRWGVNNVTKKIITLNSELLHRDVCLIDYVIVHELCHFYEANHSKNFWLQVEKRFPDYKLARKRLRVE